MTKVIKNMVKRAFAMCGVAVLAFAVLVSGFSAANPAYADEEDSQNVWVGSDDVRGDQYSPEEKVTINSGHVDAFYSFQTRENSDLLMGLSYGNVIYSPKNVTMTISDSSFYTSNLPYKNAGDIPFNTSDGYWRLNGSGNKQSSEVFPGWDSSNSRFSVGAKDTSDACADIVIDKVIAPEGGRVLAWTQKTNDNNETFVSSLEAHDKDDESVAGSRFVMPGVIHQSMVGHEHADWVFTKPGTYKISAYTIVKNKKTGTTVTSKHATYTFEVKHNKTHAVSSKTETLQMDPNRVPPTRDPKFVEESLSGSTHCREDDSNICIVGVRNTGSHPHYHSYEPGGEVSLSVYLPKSIRGKKDTKPSWTYIREDEKGPDFSYDFNSNFPVGDRDPDLKETFNIPAEPALNGMLVNATISGGIELGLGFGDDRDTVKIVVDDHGADGRPVVAAVGRMKPLGVGDTLNLRSVLYSPRVSVIKGQKQDPDVQVTSIVKRHVWLIKKAGETKFKYIPKEEGKNLNLKIDESMDGAIVRSSLVLENGELYRNEEFNDFTDYQIWLKNSEKEHSGNKDNNKKSNKKKSTNNKTKNKKNKKNKKNRKKNKNHKSNGNDESDSQNEIEDGNQDEESNNTGESKEKNNNKESESDNKDSKKNKKKNDKDKDKKKNKNKSDENEDDSNSSDSSNSHNSSESSDSDNNSFKQSATTPLVARTNTNNVFTNASGSFTKSSSKGLGGLSNGISSSKHSKKMKKVKLLSKKGKKSNKTKAASYNSDDENIEDSEVLEESEEEQEEKSHKTKWVAAAVGTASVSLCAVTGAGAFLMRPRMKLL